MDCVGDLRDASAVTEAEVHVVNIRAFLGHPVEPAVTERWPEVSILLRCAKNAPNFGHLRTPFNPEDGRRVRRTGSRNRQCSLAPYEPGRLAAPGERDDQGDSAHGDDRRSFANA